SRQKVPIDLPRQPHQRMAKVDDLLERRAEKGVLAIVARLGHRSPRQRISPPKESPTAPIGNPKTQKKPHAPPAFLQNRLLLRSNHRDRSIASEFFTDDQLVYSSLGERRRSTAPTCTWVHLPPRAVRTLRSLSFAAMALWLVTPARSISSM